MPLLNKVPHWLLVALAVAITACLLGFFVRTELNLSGGELGVPLDDTWIHFQFARNLSQGRGFSYNAGEPTPGSTAPLWTLSLAAIGLFTQEFLISSLILSSAFLLLTVGLTYGFAHCLTESRFAALLAALGVALTGRLLWAGLSGMETTAFTALSVAAVWAYTRQGLKPFPALLFGIASQLRPVGHALFALAVLDSLWNVYGSSKAKGVEGGFTIKSLVKSYAPPLIIYVAVAAPYALFSLQSTARPLPNTFYAKVATEHFFSWRTLRETLTLHWRDNPVTIVLVVLGIVPIWRKSRLVIWWLIGLPLLVAVAVDFVWHHGRYTMPLIPFQMIVAAAGADWLVRKVMASDWRLRSFDRRFHYPLAAFAIALLVVIGGWWQLPNWATMLGQNVKEVQQIDVALGQWLAANTPTGALFAVDDIGAITFLSGHRIVDMQGLVSPEMWPAIREEQGLPRDRVATRILSQLKPEYLVGFPLWHWEITTNPAVSEPLYHVETDTRTIIAQQDALVYRTNWPYLEPAVPMADRVATLDEAVQLLGYDLAPPTDDESPLVLTLYWKSLSPVPADYDVFVHVSNNDGHIVAQADQQPLRGLTPTSAWQPGDVIRDPYVIPLPADLPAGEYAITTGMYERESGRRLSVVADQAADDAIFLKTINTGAFGE